MAALELNPVMEHWNKLDPRSAAAAILPCCGSESWASMLSAKRPFQDEQSLMATAKRVWDSLSEADWRQAFDSHPRIGERKAQGSSTTASLAWSASEQSAAMQAEDAEKAALRDANLRYEQRFGWIFIICARGRSAGEILAQIERRLGNTPEDELHEAAREQARITELRLKQWLGGAQ